MAQDKRGVHVVPHQTNGQQDWQVKREHAERASGTFTTQAEARAAARQIAINSHAELYVHRKDGTIGERNSYGNDPFPPRDTDR